MFGTPSASSTPAFGTPSSAPAFGSSPSFGTPSSSPAFAAASSAPAFGAPSSAPVFGTPSSTPAFSTPTSSLPFYTPSTPAFGTPSSMLAFGAPSPLFPQQSQQQPFTIQPASLPFGNPQITTQMAPLTPVRFSLADRDIHAIIDAYKDEPGNPKYSFRHLLLSVTDHAARVKPFGASDISWAEAMRKLEGMDSLDRDRLWPQLVQGFKDLSDRLKLQDEVIISDAERLKMTQANVKLVSLNNFVLQRHFQADSFQWIQRLKQKEQTLLRRLLRVMRIVEALESKGYRIPLMKGEAELAEKLAAIARQLKGPGTELSRRVHNLLSITRMHANSSDFRDSIHILGPAKLQEQSLCDLQEALQQETEAIARLGNVLKRDVRDLEIIMSEGTDILEDGRQILKIQ